MSTLRRMRRVATVVAVVLAGLVATGPAEAAGAATSGPAQTAAYGCSGTLIDTDVAYIASGVPVLEMDLYWDGARNCAVARHVGASTNESATTYVYIARCTQTHHSSSCTVADYVYDGPGYWKSLAGPVSIAAQGHCVAVDGWIQFRGRTYTVGTATEENDPYYAAHCG